jgi:hypothetical protein
MCFNLTPSMPYVSAVSSPALRHDPARIYLSEHSLTPHSLKSQVLIRPFVTAVCGGDAALLPSFGLDVDLFLIRIPLAITPLYHYICVIPSLSTLVVATSDT